MTAVEHLQTKWVIPYQIWGGQRLASRTLQIEARGQNLGEYLPATHIINNLRTESSATMWQAVICRTRPETQRCCNSPDAQLVAITRKFWHKDRAFACQANVQGTSPGGGGH